MQRELSWGIQVVDSKMHGLGLDPDYGLQIEDRWLPTSGKGAVNVAIMREWKAAGVFEPPTNYPTAEQFVILRQAINFATLPDNPEPGPHVD
jgi:hypothetical protein